MRSGRAAEAVAHLEAALAGRPDFLPARVNYGDALRVLGRTQEAIHQYRQVLETAPDLAAVRERLASAMSQPATREVR